MSKKSEKVKALLCKNPKSSHCIVLQKNKQNEIDKKIESTFFKGQGVALPNTELYSNFEYYYLEACFLRETYGIAQLVVLD